MKRNSGFALIGAFIVIVLLGAFVGVVCYVAKTMIDKAKTVEARRQRQMTNELVEPFPIVYPSEETWMLDESEFTYVEEQDGQLVISIPDETCAEVMASVGDYRIESSRSVAGSTSSWLTSDVCLTGTVHSVRATLLDLLRYEAFQNPYPSCGFYRYTKE